MKLSFHLKYTLTALFCLSVSLVGRCAEPSAADVLRKATAKIKSAPSVDASFIATRNGQQAKGTLTVAGNRFKVLTPELSTWFDGHTQWAYMPSTKEVNITEPTTDELLEVNPVAILQRMTTEFSPRRLKATDAGTDVVELTPKSSGEIRKMVVTFNRTTSFPHQIVVTTADGSVTTLKITSIQAGPHLPAARFRFDKTRYPGVEVVDLR